ncbi:hypothetical protein FRC15_011799 [Serendipita sp. 397]|nr:hypothetical protein FRC15_011799 [Serendipita sp. 397]
MSNKIVPDVYRSIITEVIGSLRADFDEFGVGDDVLDKLRQKWESGVQASRAADFANFAGNGGGSSSNANTGQYNGIGSHSNSARTGSPVIQRTDSPTTASNSRTSRTNSVGAVTNAYNRGASSSFSSTGPSVKTEPVDRQLPPAGLPSQTHNPYTFTPAMQGLPPISLPPPGSVPSYGVPPLNFGANRGVPGYGGPGGVSDPRVLMLNRGAAPYGAGAAASGGASGSKVPQVDGTWDEEDGDEEEMARKKRKWLSTRYPWMAGAHLPNLESATALNSLDHRLAMEKMPQVDGPTSTTSPIPPLNTLPPLNLPSTSGSGGGIPPPLNLPPLRLPSEDQKPIHPSLMSMGRNSEPPDDKFDLNLLGPNNGGAGSSFARNPNVPAQPSEDINSDLDDTDDEDGPHEQPGSDPDADVTYCTYDKVTRVKAKWKVVFRDGMVHASGKDYLFGRCTGEFEW